MSRLTEQPLTKICCRDNVAIVSWLANIKKGFTTLIAQLRNTYAYIASYTARTYVPDLASQ